jgi:hypothetical protein
LIKVSLHSFIHSHISPFNLHQGGPKCLPVVAAAAAAVAPICCFTHGYHEPDS